MDAVVCPKGHNSTEPDYCSECGAKIPAASAAADSAPNPPTEASPETGTCPSCGAPRNDGGTAFCELCGCDFAAPPAAPEPGAIQPQQTREIPGVVAWSVTVSVDPALREAQSPEPPAGFEDATIDLKQPVSLIGRRSDARAIFPEIDLYHDDAVSHRHALLQLYSSGVLLLRDIGSSNGTRLNGKAIDPMIDYPLKDGDDIALGHWSRIRVTVLTVATIP